MQFKILLAIVFVVTLSNAQMIRLPVTRGYFNVTNNVTTQGNGFLSDTESLPVDKTDNSYYTVSLNIGAANETFILVFDTAEYFTWVETWNTETNEPHHFDCNTTNTCDASNYLFPIARSNGTTVRADYIKDQINFGNETVQQGFLLFNNNLSILDNPADGVLGLGIQYTIAGLGVGITPFVDNLQEQGLIGHKNFSIFLANDTITPNNLSNGTVSNNGSNGSNATEQSWLILGGYDPLLMTTSDFMYYPLAVSYEWKINVVSVWFYGNNWTTAGSVLFDSRSGSTQLPQAAFNQFLDWARGWNPSCESVTIGDIVTIQCVCGEVVAPIDTIMSFQFSATDGMFYNITADQLMLIDGETCYLDIVQAGNSNDDWVLGHQFQMNYYMFYDEDNKQIGIAPANHTIPN